MSQFSADTAGTTLPASPAALATRGPRVGLLLRVAAYGASRGATEGLLTLRSVLLAALLGPAAFGSWALLRLAMRYALLARLGVLRGLEVELMRPGASSDASARSGPAPTTFGFILIVGGTLSAVAAGLATVVDNPDYRLILIGFSVASLAEAVYGYVLVCLRIRADLRRYAILETSTAVLHVLLAVGLARTWGLGGAFLGLALANLAGITAGAKWAEFRFALSREQLRRLFAVGLPVTLSSSVGLLLITGDRWIVAGWGGVTMLGYYAFAASTTTAAAGLGTVIRTVVFRDVYGEVSSAGAAAALESHLERSLLPFAWLLPPMLGLIGLAAAPAVALLMPEYHPAVAPGRLFLLAGAAMGLINLASIGAIAAGQQRWLPLYAAIALALSTALSALALWAGAGLEGVAWAALAGYMCYAAAALRVVVRETGIPDAERFVANTLLPLAWCAAAVATVSRFFPAFDPASIVVSLLAYLLLLFPLVPRWLSEWRELVRRS